MTTRALFSLNDEVMALFRAVVPARERSKTIERFMREEIERRQSATDRRIEQLATLVETDPVFRQVRAVSDDVDAVAGEALE